ncbi:MAG: Ig-like domain-containing protein [Ruminococcus sp.]|nr:Ig-like domain-containing protein [Ruminococcus sp.]
MKKLVSITLAAILIVSCFAFAVNAQSTVSIRIEGKNSTYFSGDVAISGDGTVLDAVKALDEAEESLNVKIVDSQYGAYISEINGDKEATEFVPNSEDPEQGTTYYIGWMFAVNGQNSSVGVSGYELKGGEDIVLYYADMNAQVPVADFSEKGKIKLTSYNWLPDWSGMDWMPVKGVKVYLNDKEYISDDEGVVTYNPDDFKCLVNVQVEAYDELGYPLVCRFADNYGFDINQFKDTEATETQPATDETQPVTEAQKPVTVNFKSTLYVKGTYQIALSSEDSVSYTSSNSKVAAVSANGKITAVKAGTATITAASGNTTAKYKITVKNPTLNATKKTLKKGKSFTLKVTGAVGSVKYSTSKKSVATVSSKGKVTAKKKGKAVISVKTNGLTLKCNVTVK